MAALIIMGQPAPSCAQRMAQFDIGQSDFIAPPRIIKPSTETVSISGSEGIELKWSPHEGDQTQRNYYDFRMYRGYQMLESTLMLKMRIPPRQWSVVIGPENFEVGAVYTCSIRQVYNSSARSRKSFVSFKVIKRPGKK